MSLKETILKSWDIGNPILIIVAYIFTYAGSSVPSFAGLIPIYLSKTCLIVVLVIDAIYKYATLKSHPVSEAYIWTFENWQRYSLGRISTDLMINFLYIVTQAWPGVNWILNLLPLGLSYYFVYITS